MAYDCRVYRILIASPSDVEDEREIAVTVIQEWNNLYSYSRKVALLPLRWETHTAPEYGTRPQEVINLAIVDECDLLVGIFWTRIGSPTGIGDSGTLEDSVMHAPNARAAADMGAVGCCAIRNGTNGWDWSDNKSRQRCLKDAHDAGLTASDVFHYPKETCQSVKKRCGMNPCE
jgi:hypothetical protein